MGRPLQRVVAAPAAAPKPRRQSLIRGPGKKEDRVSSEVTRDQGRREGTIGTCTRHVRGRGALTHSPLHAVEVAPRRQASCGHTAAAVPPARGGQPPVPDPSQGSAPCFFPTACQTQQGCRRERTKGRSPEQGHGTLRSWHTSLTGPHDKALGSNQMQSLVSASGAWKARLAGHLEAPAFSQGSLSGARS